MADSLFQITYDWIIGRADGLLAFFILGIGVFSMTLDRRRMIATGNNRDANMCRYLGATYVIVALAIVLIWRLL